MKRCRFAAPSCAGSRIGFRSLRFSTRPGKGGQRMHQLLPFPDARSGAEIRAALEPAQAPPTTRQDLAYRPDGPGFARFAINLPDPTTLVEFLKGFAGWHGACGLVLLLTCARRRSRRVGRLSMGIFGALTTAVSGLRAQSYALENISGNIANSQTPGFKRVETSFVDLIPELPYRARARRLGDGLLAPHQHDQGRPERDRHRDQCRDQRRGLLHRPGAGRLLRQPADLRRHGSLHPARRLPARQGRLSRQRRRLLPARHVDRSGHGTGAGQRERVIQISSEPVPSKKTT